MNFLAHLHLAEATPESRLGNLLGDFVKGRAWDERFPDPIWQGIVEHRHVDAYTDAHPAWRRSRDLLPVGLRRLAGIVVDIYYDHLLQLHWRRFETGPDADAFIEAIHGQLRSMRPLIPAEVLPVVERMIEQRWLGESSSLEGIGRTVERVSRRSPVLAGIFEASRILEEQFPELERDFLEFYPDLVAEMPELRARIRDRRLPRGGENP